jgi:hypothetical protein
VPDEFVARMRELFHLQAQLFVALADEEHRAVGLSPTGQTIVTRLALLDVERIRHGLDLVGARMTCRRDIHAAVTVHAARVTEDRQHFGEGADCFDLLADRHGARSAFLRVHRRLGEDR